MAMSSTYLKVFWEVRCNCIELAGEAGDDDAAWWGIEGFCNISKNTNCMRYW